MQPNKRSSEVIRFGKIKFLSSLKAGRHQYSRIFSGDNKGNIDKEDYPEKYVVKEHGKIHETSVNGHDFFRAEAATATPTHSGPVYGLHKEPAASLAVSLCTLPSIQRTKCTFTPRRVHVQVSRRGKLGHTHMQARNSRNTGVI